MLGHRLDSMLASTSASQESLPSPGSACLRHAAEQGVQVLWRGALSFVEG